MLLEAESSGSGQGEVATGAFDRFFVQSVAKASVVVLAVRQEVEPGSDRAFEAREGEAGGAGGLERLEVPGYDGGVAGAAIGGVSVVPTTSVGLVAENPLGAGCDGFFELRSDGELAAEEIALGESVDGDGVFVAPMLVAEIGGAFAALFHAVVREEEDAIGDGRSELEGSGGFAMTEEGEKGETGHRHRFLSAPGPVLVLVFLEPTEGLQDSVLAGFVAAAVGEALEAV